jgi:surfeit locus 1 family protein
MRLPPQFRPALVPSLTVAVLLPLFLYLGYWQLQRAEEKRELQSEYDARATGPTVKVETRVQRPEELQFYRVIARGYYETGYQVLVDNRVHQGQAGYEVITPLRLPDSDVRCWSIAAGFRWARIAAIRRRSIRPEACRKSSA